jgi:predicted YcjX-like family ATPase
LAARDGTELWRALDWVGARASEAWRGAAALIRGRHLRVGVTGLSGAGKTVFTTSLVHALRHAAANPLSMPLFAATVGGAPLRVELATLDDLPRFPYEANIAGLLATPPHWPPPTERLSGIRIALDRASDADPALRVPELVVDIVDYPGEWLIDLELLRLDYAQWSAACRARLVGAERLAPLPAQAWRALAASSDDAGALAAAHGELVLALRAAGLRYLQPGRLLAPGAEAIAPASLPAPLQEARAGAAVHQEMARRYLDYRERVVAPFFRGHFARLQRQIVLCDVIGALAQGPASFADTEAALTSALGAFRYRALPWLNWFRSRIDRVLIAATKVDHVTTSQYLNLSNLLSATFERGGWAREIGAVRMRFDVLASLRATVDGWYRQDGAQRAAIQGVLKDPPRGLRLLVPSDVPPAAPPAEAWPEGGFVFHAFEPPSLAPYAAMPLPNVNLDKAIDFLIGDRLT